MGPQSIDRFLVMIQMYLHKNYMRLSMYKKRRLFTLYNLCPWIQ